MYPRSAKSGLASLLYCSFLGGSGNEKGHSVAVNANGGAIAVGGYTDSSDFPTTPASIGASPRRNSKATALWLNSERVNISRGLNIAPLPYIAARRSTARTSGGILKVPRDDTYGVAIDSRGLILATGRTQSADFPMTTPYVQSRSIFNSAPYLQPGNDQPYLVKIDPSLIGKASLTYSTFLAAEAIAPAWLSIQQAVPGLPERMTLMASNTRHLIIRSSRRCSFRILRIR